jgi:plastocyanin
VAHDDEYDEHFDDDGFDDELDDADGGAPKKKRMATSTKIVLVVAGWILLTLFLVGEFSKDKTPVADPASAQLDTVEGEDVPEEEELFIDEEVALEEFDTDGDGVLSDTERAAAVEAYEAAVASGEIAIGEPWKGVTGGTATATEEGAGESAMPGAGPTSGGSGSSSGTGTSGGSTAGGGSTTTTAASGGGGGGGGGESTTTTAKAPGGNPTTTVKPTTTTSPTTTQAPPPPPPGGGTPVTFTVTASNLAYHSDQNRTITLPRGSKITFDNQEGNNSIDHSFTIEGGWDSGTLNRNADPKTSPELQAGSYTFSCKVHPALPAMRGSLTIT